MEETKRDFIIDYVTNYLENVDDLLIEAFYTILTDSETPGTLEKPDTSETPGTLEKPDTSDYHVQAKEKGWYCQYCSKSYVSKTQRSKHLCKKSPAGIKKKISTEFGRWWVDLKEEHERCKKCGRLYNTLMPGHKVDHDRNFGCLH
jgi:hypothetical protein